MSRLVLKVSISFTIVDDIRWKNVMRVEDDKFFPVRGGTRIMPYLQWFSMDQLGASIDLSWQHLA